MAFSHALYQPEPPESESGPILAMLNCNTQAGAAAYLTAFPDAALCALAGFAPAAVDEVDSTAVPVPEPPAGGRAGGSALPPLHLGI